MLNYRKYNSYAPVPGSLNANHVQAYTREYDYDKLGNVLQVKQLGNNAFTRNFSYHTGKNTLERVETGSASLIEDFTYDACGNQLTAGASRNYIWNAANQLITYYNQAGSADPTIFAQYDYAGQERVSKMVRTGTSANPIYERTIYIDGIFEYHILENGTTYEKNYIHIMDDRSRIAMVRVGGQFPDDINEAITYNLENQIGSSTVRLTETGTIIDKEEYYPFGDSSLRTFSKKRYRYVGREKDLESGLYYYGARYYCAWTCRFISVDPLASKYAQLTPYNYADNNPVNDYDIDGMQDTGSEETPQTTPSDSTGTQNDTTSYDAGDSYESPTDSTGIEPSDTTRTLQIDSLGTLSKELPTEGIQPKTNTITHNRNQNKSTDNLVKDPIITRINNANLPDSVKEKLTRLYSEYKNNYAGSNMSNKPTSSGTGEERAKLANEYSEDREQRKYGQGVGRIDCSGFTKEISEKIGDNAFKDLKYDAKFSSSLAANQARHLSEKGILSLNVKDIQIGDYIFWGKSKTNDLSQITHTGVVTEISNGVVTVVNAQVSGASNSSGIWEGGKKSILKTTLSPDGTIWPRSSSRYFIATGRPK